MKLPGSSGIWLSLLLVAAGLMPALAQRDSTRQRIDALLGTHDTFITPEEWNSLGVEAAKILETIAADSTAVPSRRARALEGITQIMGADAAVILHGFAYAMNEPPVVRMAAIHGLGRVLAARQLLPELGPLLSDQSNPGVRGTAAEVLTRDAAGSIEAHKQGKKESAGWRARFLNEQATSPIPLPPQSSAGSVAPPLLTQSQLSSAIANASPASTPSIVESSSTSEQTIDFGVISVSSNTLSGFVNLTVPVGALSIDVFAVAVSDPTSRIVVYRIDSPDGRLYDYPSANPTMKVLPPSFAGSVSILAPNSPSLPFSPGAWKITFLGSKATTAAVKAIIKSGVSPNAGVLDMNLFFVGTGTLNATTAPTDFGFQGMLSTLRDTYAQVAIRLNNIHYLDITGSAATQYSDLNESDLPALVQLSAAAGAQDNAVNVFFVHTIMGGALEGYVILGESAGIPGLPMLGTTQSGLVIATSDFGVPGNDIAATWGHEMGHWLGLFHTTESSGLAFDPLGDTPQCDRSFDTNSDGIMQPSECIGHGAENLMFWTSDPSTNHSALTSNQAFVMQANPLVTDTNLLGLTSFSRTGSAGMVTIQGIGVPTALHTVQSSSTTPDAAAFTPLSSTISDNTGHWQYIRTNTQGLTKAFYRITYP